MKKLFALMAVVAAPIFAGCGTCDTCIKTTKTVKTTTFAPEVSCGSTVSYMPSCSTCSAW